MRDKEVLTFEAGMTVAGPGHARGLDVGDFYLEVVPKIFAAYSHEAGGH
jgi:hypothetical protein